jgi:hypothetical protein
MAGIVRRLPSSERRPGRNCLPAGLPPVTMRLSRNLQALGTVTTSTRFEFP